MKALDSAYPWRRFYMECTLAGGFAPRPHHLPAPPVDLLLKNFFAMVQHMTQNIIESRPRDICHSFTICHSHCEWGLHCPAFYKSLPRQFSQKLIKIKHYINIHSIYISGNQFPSQTAFWKKKEQNLVVFTPF